LPLVLAAFSLSTNYALSLLALLVVGWAMISINATINTVIQTNVPDELRGRVNGVYALLFIGVAPLGNLQAGIVADHFGAPAAVFIGALMSGLVVLYILLRKRHIFSME
jgi:predicted MFS family arabinose efflux permease